MSTRSVAMVFLALTCGLSAAAGVKVIRDRANQKQPDTNTVPVAVASFNIPRGFTLSEEHIRIQQWPADLAPAGAAKAAEDASGRTSLTGFVKDEPILMRKLAGEDAGRGMAPLIPKGMRAFTIHTPTYSSRVSGFLLPGNNVDILLTVTRAGRGDGTGGGHTTTLLQNVEILAAGQLLNPPSENKVDPRRLRSVTLLVSPNQAQELSLAQAKGTLHLALRNDGDVAPADTKPVTMHDIRYLVEEPNEEIDMTEEVDEKPTLAMNIVEFLKNRKPPERPPVRIRTLRGRVGGQVLVRK